MPPPKPAFRFTSDADLEKSLEAMNLQLAQMDLVRRAIQNHGAWLKKNVASVDQNGDPVFDERLMRYLAWDSVVSLHWLALQGDREASKALAGMTLSGLEPSFQERIEHWSEQDTLTEMIHQLREKGFSEETARKIVDVMVGETKALPEET